MDKQTHSYANHFYQTFLTFFKHPTWVYCTGNCTGKPIERVVYDNIETFVFTITAEIILCSLANFHCQ